MYKKSVLHFCTSKVAFLLIRPIVVFHRSPALPSPLSTTRFYIWFGQTLNIIESFVLALAKSTYYPRHGVIHPLLACSTFSAAKNKTSGVIVVWTNLRLFYSIIFKMLIRLKTFYSSCRVYILLFARTAQRCNKGRKWQATNRLWQNYTMWVITFRGMQGKVLKW